MGKYRYSKNRAQSEDCLHDKFWSFDQIKTRQRSQFLSKWPSLLGSKCSHYGLLLQSFQITTAIGDFFTYKLVKLAMETNRASSARLLKGHFCQEAVTLVKAIIAIRQLKTTPGGTSGNSMWQTDSGSYPCENIALTSIHCVQPNPKKFNYNQF